MVYFDAFIGTSLLMLIGGIFIEGFVWAGLEALHASKTVLMSGEILALLALGVMFVVVYKRVLQVEKDILANKL